MNSKGTQAAWMSSSNFDGANTAKSFAKAKVPHLHI
jgi:hypothetical protein